MFKTHRTFELTTGVKSNSIAVFVSKGRIQVLYHNTKVVDAVRSNNRWIVELQNGGWDTISTRTVINRALEQIPGYGRGCFLKRVKGVTLYTDTKHNDIVLPFNTNTLILS